MAAFTREQIQRLTKGQGLERLVLGHWMRVEVTSILKRGVDQIHRAFVEFNWKEKLVGSEHIHHTLREGEYSRFRLPPDAWE